MVKKGNILETKRCFLKPVENSDIGHIFRGLSHPEIIKYYGVNYHTLEETNEQMNWYSNLEKSGSSQWWIIRLNDSSTFCGAIGYNDLNLEHKKAEIGFWLFPEFWGKGVMKECALKITDYLFREIGVHRIEAFVEERNKNSIRLLSKLGFKYEGTMDDCEVKNGEFISVSIYAYKKNYRGQYLNSYLQSQ